MRWYDYPSPLAPLAGLLAIRDALFALLVIAFGVYLLVVASTTGRVAGFLVVGLGVAMGRSLVTGVARMLSDRSDPG